MYTDFTGKYIVYGLTPVQCIVKGLIYGHLLICRCDIYMAL